jgi:spore coat polysaccharide biosynthesis predicted glycosyltransferase SpsG
MRCLAFAAALPGSRSVFVTRAYDERISAVIKNHGYEVVEVPEDASPEEDLEITKRAAGDCGAKLLVTDLFVRPILENFEKLDSYHRQVRADHFVIAIASGEVTDVDADVAVSPYMGFQANASQSARSGTRLIGPDYFIFRPEFIAAAKKTRSIAQEAHNILVTVGGSDDLNLSTKIAGALCELAISGLNIHMVFGAGYSEELRRDVRTVLEGVSGECAFLEQNTDIAAEMQWSDLAIIGDGLTKYEVAVTGTPSIMLSRPESEEELNILFQEAGTTRYLGTGCILKVAVLTDTVRDVMNDYHLRRSMSEKGKAILDGKGLERIIANVPQEILAGGVLN